MDPHNYLLMTLDGKLLRGVFEHERLKPTVLKTDQGNVSSLPALKKVINLEITPEQIRKRKKPSYLLIKSYKLQDQ